MLHDGKNTKDASISVDFDTVTHQLTALREDMSRLAETVSGIAGRRGGRIISDIAEGFDEAKAYAKTKGRSAESQLEETVAVHPILAIGLAVGAGFMVGALSRR